MENNRIIFLAALLICGIMLSVGGNYLLGISTPVRQESSLLENYLIMQSMAGKNASYANQTYMIGDSGIVLSFNDILNIRDSPVKDVRGVVNATAPLTMPRSPVNKTNPEVLS